MGRKSDIEWTEGTWEPVLGCEDESPGCLNCYAKDLVARRMGRNPCTPRYHGLAVVEQTSGRAKWTKKVALQPDHLGVPLHWRDPTRVFVCSRSDLFHVDVPFSYIAAVHAVMAACPHVTFMLLTKRDARMREFYQWWTSIGDLAGSAPLHYARVVASREGAKHDRLLDVGHLEQRHRDVLLPLPNVQVGVTVESSDYKHRLDNLYDTPGIAKRWASFEPLLGDLGELGPRLPELDWAVLGGESGKHARRCDIGWIERALLQLTSARVATFVKQLGSNVTMQADDWRDGVIVGEPYAARVPFLHKKGADVEEWKSRGLVHLCVREVV